MSSSKKRKLSLKKTGAATLKSSTQAGNTIVSMFKQQVDRETRFEGNKESGSEGDVVITNVIGLDKDLSQTLLQSVGDGGAGSNKNQSNKETRNRKELSLSGRKRLRDRRSSESASDTDFKFEKTYLKKRKSKHGLSRLSSERDVNRQDSPYKLRKRNTVPVVEVSDSEIKTDKPVHEIIASADLEDSAAGNDKESKKCDEHGQVAGVSVLEIRHEIGHKGKTNAGSEVEDNDAILFVETSRSTSRYFSSSNNGKLANPAGKKKLSLKKAKLENHTTNEKEKVAKRKHIEKGNKEVVSELADDNDNDYDCSKADSDNVIDNRERNMSPINDKTNKRKNKKTDSKEAVVNKTESRKVPIQQGQSNNVNCVLMQRPCSSKQEIFKDNENTRLNCDENGKSDLGDSKGKEKGSMINSKSSLKSNAKKPNKSKQRADSDSKEDSNKGVDVDLDTGGFVGDDENSNDVPESSESTEFRVPYYLENFNTIMGSVLEDEENARLFDITDMKSITNFKNLEESGQKLYVRLFSRKLTWLPMSKVNYPEISDNIPDVVDVLIEAGLLQSGASLSDLPVVLKILSAPDMKSLAKSFHINSMGLTKVKIIDMLLKKSQQSSISTMFKGGATGTMANTILNRAKSYLGQVCRLADEPRAVFIRILMLFSLYNTNFDEESGGGGQNQLFQMLVVNIGRVVYPSYTVNRNVSVFQDRAALVRFETGLQFEIDIHGLTERGKWTDAYHTYKQAKEAGRPVTKDTNFLKWDRKLPQFLRLYTAGCVYTRIDNLGVEILQRLKLYTEAASLLEELLAHDLYCIQYRGHWYERLAINLEAHLKSVEKSLHVIKRGLADATIRTGRRLALYERARKICEAPKSKFSDQISEFEHQLVLPTPQVHIEGMVMSDATAVGMRCQFVIQGDSDSVTLCVVEELVLEHYKQNGYPEGIHAEGSIVSNLFVLLFWDIMFMDVPNVFHGPFQSCPLDIATQDFYTNRQSHVDDRLEWLRTATAEELTREIGSVWKDHAGTICAGINWDKFSGPESHQNLASCMKGPVIAGILERYVKDPRHTRSGFPDLTLWNTDTKQFKICEVKGPNDRLSYKQILWIDYLHKLGVDAEACYVKAVGSKKLKPVMKN